MRTLITFEPGVRYNDSVYSPFLIGNENDIFIKWSGKNPDFDVTNSNIMLGYVKHF